MQSCTNEYFLNSNFYYVEDEFPFVCICNLYNNVRSKYLPAATNMSRYEFHNLMSTENAALLRNLSRFIFYSNNVRKCYIETL